VPIWVLRLLILLLAACDAAASAPLLEVSPSMPSRSIGTAMSVAILPLAQPADPDSLWSAAPSDISTWTDGNWVARPGRRVVGRARLVSPQGGLYVLQALDSSADRVRVWFRQPGQPWQGAEAGDRVPISQWPFLGQFPSFALALTEQPLDLIVMVENGETLGVPLWLRSDAGYRGAQFLQASFIGLAMGLGLMGALMSLVSAATFRRRADWMVLGYALWCLVVVISITGYMAVWFTPNAIGFNDYAKDVSLILLGGLMVGVVAEVLDHLDILGLQRWLGIAFVLLGIAFALVYVFVLPGLWRTKALAWWEAWCVLAAAVLCGVSWLRGSHLVALPAAAVAMTALTVAMQYDAFALGDDDLDLTSVLAALLLFASAQLLRQTLFLRERLGRAVLGRAAISANRDPLTALLSYAGMQHSYDEASLRRLAGRGQVALMLLSLPRFDECSLEHGLVLTERGVVRFAAALQQVLGHQWQIGRLSKTRFAALSNMSGGSDRVVETATRVLTHCARLQEPLSPLRDFDLRIVCAQRSDTGTPFRELLRELEDASLALEDNKRIALA
jgi:GGDEF domain-containing protein